MNINKEKVRKKFGIHEDSKVIMAVQRIDPKLGHIQLIKALPLILKKVPNTRLVFVGGDSMSNKISESRQKLKKEAFELIEELGVKDKIIWTGTVDYFELPELYNAADINCLCSKNEGFGLAVTEGMACGLPTIGTRAGGIPLQIEDGKSGFLVDVGDYKKTAERAIQLLTNNELAEKISKAGLKSVEENFLVERGVEKHLILYNRIMKIKDDFHRLKFLDREEISAIITDFDRTITEEAPKIVFDPKDIDEELLKEMKTLEKDLFLATGRQIKYVKNLCKKFKIWKAVIAENGAVIYFPSTKKTITLNTEYMKKAKKIIKNMNLENCTTGKVIASIHERDEKKVMKALGEIAEHVLFERNVDEIMVLPMGVDKGLGVRMAMQYLNIDTDKTIVVGDGENDRSMFLNPGFKIALANADDKLKKLANHITDAPSVKGMYEILSELKKN